MSVALGQEDARRLQKCIAGGGVAVFPSDTVYGVCCDPEDEGAVRRLYELKGRPPQRAAAANDDLGENSEPANELVRQTVTFIEEHFAEDLTLGQIANAMRRSDRHIRQHFEESLGISPMRFLLRYRVQKAKELIQYSDYGLKKVAEMTGFTMKPPEVSTTSR